MGSQEEHVIHGTLAEAQARQHFCDIGAAGSFYLRTVQEAYKAAQEYWDAILAKIVNAHPDAVDERARMAASELLLDRNRYLIHPFSRLGRARALYQWARERQTPIEHSEVEDLLNKHLQELRAAALT